MRRLRWVVAVVVGVGLLAGGVGCSDDDPSAAPSAAPSSAAEEGYRDELEQLPGVVAASVERTAFDSDYYGEDIVVDMTIDATAGQITTVLDSFVARAAEKGQPQQARITLGAGTTDTTGDPFEKDAPPQVEPASRHAGNVRAARTVTAAVAAFPDANVAVAGDQWTVIAPAEPERQSATIDAMIRTVLGDPVLGASDAVDIRASDGDPGNPRSIALVGSDGLSDGLLTAWRTLGPRLDPAVLQRLMVLDEAIHLDVRAGAGVLPRDLTTAAYGELLWPTVRGALDSLRGMSPAARLTVSNLYDDIEVPEAEGYYLEDRFLVVGPRLRTGRDRLERTWNAEAADYLAARSG